ncbi:MAG TPA: hypothetical protein VL171_10090 [Verrucomicrobiae bacterium]|nr:hypothetical protein [Verrucomicrobiae bacterium]
MESNIDTSLEEAILGHLDANPGAKDTLDGIIAWWFLEQRLQQSISEVQTAVDSLVLRNKLRPVQGTDGKTYYCRAEWGGQAGNSIGHVLEC